MKRKGVLFLAVFLKESQLKFNPLPARGGREKRLGGSFFLNFIRKKKSSLLPPKKKKEGGQPASASHLLSIEEEA